MYQNIIFDFGGVVVDYNPRNFLMDRFMNKHAEEIVYDLTFGSQECRIWTVVPLPGRWPTAP